LITINKYFIESNVTKKKAFYFIESNEIFIQNK